ncbi:MAG TPA: hypothetical protein VF230_00935 [Acidimicrobiales bacterium]
MAALEAGVDPALVAERTRKAQSEIVAAEAILNSTPDAPAPLTVDEVVATLEALRNVPRLLEVSGPRDPGRGLRIARYHADLPPGG